MSDQVPPLPRRLSSNEPLDHIPRSPLPWRPAQPLTECGISTEGRSLVTREELSARVLNLGQARAAYTACWRG